MMTGEDIIATAVTRDYETFTIISHILIIIGYILPIL